MTEEDPWKRLNHEAATKLIISWLRNQDYGQFGAKYGYDIYLPTLAKHHLAYKCQISDQYQREKIFEEHSPLFYSSLWELCRRGIIRPGVTKHREQATEDGSAGNGYSITDFGKQWLAESNHNDFVPTEPEAFGKLLEKYKDLFGQGFHQRAQEAIRCYGAHAYLACCSMCGAAAESILLMLAITKDGSENKIAKLYSGRDGRKNLEKLICHQQKGYIQENIALFNSILKYWRDESAHGKTTSINENEALTSLALLLRLAQFISENYQTLTDKTE